MYKKRRVFSKFFFFLNSQIKIAFPDGDCLRVWFPGVQNGYFLVIPRETVFAAVFP